MRASGLAVLALFAASPGTSAGAEDTGQRVLAAALIEQAVKRCGHELSSAGELLGKHRAPGALQSQFVEQLWDRTWKCDPAFIGQSCMAARWTLCERVFAEYGPDGVVLPGLLKPIIHK